MKNTKKTSLSVAELKERIDQEREKMDRLEDHGSAPMASYNCEKRIEALQKALKETHGVDY